MAFQPRVAIDDEFVRLAHLFKVSTLVMLRRLGALGVLDDDAMWALYRRESARLQGFSSAPKGGGGNFILTQRARLGRRFTQALAVSTLAGQTLYRDAYRLSGCRKSASFDALAQAVGIH